MRRFLLGRLVALVVTLIIASFVIFMAVSLAPGDPAARLAGNRATPQVIAAIRAQLGLNRPLLERYADWLGGALHGNLGVSYQYNENVTTIIGQRLGQTLFLVLYAAIITLVVGYLIGIAGGAFRRAAVPVAALNGLMIAVPSFIAAVLLIDFFSLRLGWFPAVGGGQGFVGNLRHLTLPAIALAISWSAYVSQITRTALRSEASKEHVETAVIRGLLPVNVFRKHVLRNAAPPLVSVAALSVGGMLVGTVVVEEAFGLSGLGSALVQAVATKDNQMTEALALLFVVVFTIINTGADLFQGVLDPRTPQLARA